MHQTAVHRDDLGGADHEPVAPHDLVDRYGHQGVAVLPARRPGRPGDKKAELPVSPRGGPGLEQRASGEHHRDHGSSERLVDQQGTDQGEQSDDVDTRLPKPHRGDGRHQRQPQAEQRADRPQQGSCTAPATCGGSRSGQQQGQPGSERQRAPAVAQPLPPAHHRSPQPRPHAELLSQRAGHEPLKSPAYLRVYADSVLSRLGRCQAVGSLRPGS